MKKQLQKGLFVSFNLAMLLKEKGFNELCFAFYHSKSIDPDLLFPVSYKETEIFYQRPHNTLILAPFYQQVINWLREEHNIDVWIEKDYQVKRYFIQCPQLTDTEVKFNPWSEEYYEALNKAIEKALTLVKVKNKKETKDNPQDLIDVFIRNFNEDSTEQLKVQFIEFCKKKNITEEEITQWKKDFQSFMIDNPTFDMTWVTQYLLNNEVK